MLPDSGSCIEKLPPELILPILINLPDLESLHNIVRALPTAYRVFDGQSAEIFKKVLFSGGTHTYTRAIILIVALLRVNALPSTIVKILDLKDLLMHETSPHRYVDEKRIHPELSWPEHLSSKFVRGLLVENHKINRLTTGCLDLYLQRFQTLEPFHPAEFSFDSSTWLEMRPNVIGPWQEKKTGSIYYFPKKNIGPPTWLEQQRLVQAFWRIELSRELNHAIDTNGIAWAKDAIELGDINWRTPEALFYIPRSNLEFYDEIRYTKTVLEHELLQAATQYMQEVEDKISESEYWQLQIQWNVPSYPKSHEDWELLDMSHGSNTWTLFGHVTGHEDEHLPPDYTFRSPLQHSTFGLWRRFGFAIWCTARLVAYGLLPHMERYSLGMAPPYFEAWRSILTHEERDILDAANEIRDQNYPLWWSNSDI